MFHLTLEYPLSSYSLTHTPSNKEAAWVGTKSSAYMIDIYIYIPTIWIWVHKRVLYINFLPVMDWMQDYNSFASLFIFWVWGCSSVGEHLPCIQKDLIPLNSHKKARQTWQCTLVIPALGRQRQTNPW